MVPEAAWRDRIRAFAGGVAGTAAMMIAASAAGSPVMRDLQRLSGSMAFAPGTTGSRLTGAGLQFLNGGLLAQGYLAAMGRAKRTAGWQAGLGIGVVHGVIAGGLLGIVPALHPRVPEEVPAPGWFLSRQGAGGAVTLIALHALFGAVVGTAIGAGGDAPAAHRNRSRVSFAP